MTFLFDSSVWLEALLNQPAAPEARASFAAVPPAELAISQFAVHSIGLILTRRGYGVQYTQFLREVIIAGAVTVIALAPEQLAQLPAACTTLALDFDDAYQYTAADQAGLTLVSFDAHFDRTPRGRMTPSAAMKMLP